MQRVLAIINPVSGTHQGAQIALWLSEIAGRRSIQLTTRLTETEQSATMLVADAAEYERVVVSGGDGTVTEVLSGLVGTNVPVAILPGGTGNVLCQAIGVNWDVRQACEDALADCDMLVMDLGVLNDNQYFALRLSVGYEAMVTRDTTREKKSRYGKLAYLIEGVRNALRLSDARYRIDVDGIVMRKRAESIWVANTSAIGILGLHLDTAISLTDQKLDLVIFRFSFLRDLQRLFQALLRRERLPQTLVEHFSVENYVSIVASDRQPVQVDGDTIGMTPCRIRVVPAAVRVCKPGKTVSSLSLPLRSRQV